MPRYYVNNNEQPNGDHEVHVENCSRIQSSTNLTYLGVFSNCRDAVAEAKRRHPQSNGCYYCSNECHTS